MGKNGKAKNFDKRDKDRKTEQISKKQERAEKKIIRKQKFRTAKNYASCEEQEFCAMIQQLGLRVKYVSGDGNCMFRSIADQLNPSDAAHIHFREIICDFIESHGDHFQLFIEDDEPFADYLARMRDIGEWGGHQELFAASQCLKVNIVVHQVGAPRFILQSDIPTEKEIHISYHGECHYNSIRLITDKDNGNPADPISLCSISVGAAGVVEKEADMTAQERTVSKALPWVSHTDIKLALDLVGQDADEAIEFIISNPEGLRDMQMGNPKSDRETDTDVTPALPLPPASVSSISSSHETISVDIVPSDFCVPPSLFAESGTPVEGGQGEAEVGSEAKNEVNDSVLDSASPVLPSNHVKGPKDRKAKKTVVHIPPKSKSKGKAEEPIPKSSKPMSKKEKRKAEKNGGVVPLKAGVGGGASDRELQGGKVGAGGVLEIVL